MNKAKMVYKLEGEVMMGRQQIMKLTAADTAEQLSVTFSKNPAGWGILLHVQSREDEAFQITEGLLELTLNGETQILAQGDMVFLPKNILQGFSAINDTQLWVTLVPGGAESLFTEMAALPGQPDKNQSMPLLSALAFNLFNKS